MLVVQEAGFFLPLTPVPDTAEVLLLKPPFESPHVEHASFTPSKLVLIQAFL